MKSVDRHISGFTLIEMIAVLALAAVLATLVTTSLTALGRQVRMSDLIEQLQFYDDAMRQHARGLGIPQQMVFDLGTGQVHRIDARNQSPLGHALRLPPDLGISQVRVGNAVINGTQVAIPCSLRGTTPSYAVKIVSQTEPPQWLLVAGLSGEYLVLNNDQDVQALFKAKEDAVPR